MDYGFNKQIYAQNFQNPDEKKMASEILSTKNKTEKNSPNRQNYLSGLGSTQSKKLLEKNNTSNVDSENFSSNRGPSKAQGKAAIKNPKGIQIDTELYTNGTMNTSENLNMNLTQKNPEKFLGTGKGNLNKTGGDLDLLKQINNTSTNTGSNYPKILDPSSEFMNSGQNNTYDDAQLPRNSAGGQNRRSSFLAKEAKIAEAGAIEDFQDMKIFSNSNTNFNENYDKVQIKERVQSKTTNQFFSGLSKEDRESLVKTQRNSVNGLSGVVKNFFDGLDTFKMMNNLDGLLSVYDMDTVKINKALDLAKSEGNKRSSGNSRDSKKNAGNNASKSVGKNKS
jgi:hypothetical protein